MKGYKGHISTKFTSQAPIEMNDDAPKSLTSFNSNISFTTCSM